MSGTLIVQNLQGPASGANANKIIVPAGQVLDASAGTFTPSVDQIVQVKTGTTASQIDTASTSYVVANLSVTITPKYANSLILLSVKTSSRWSVDATSTEYIYATIFRNGTNIGVGSSSSLALMGAYGAYQGWAKPFNFGTEDSPNTTSSVQYTMYLKKYGSTSISVHDERFRNIITATEVKQ